MMEAELRTFSSAARAVSACPHCGASLTHLQGATGRISICQRCGWSRTETAQERRTRRKLEGSQGRGE
jgi:anaerobic ribonucleoside-triphosphate reductase